MDTDPNNNILGCRRTSEAESPRPGVSGRSVGPMRLGVIDSNGKYLIVYNGAQQPFECSVCNCRLERMSQMMRCIEHMRTHSSSEDESGGKVVQCGKCRAMWHPSSVPTHYVRCKGTIALPGACPVCGKVECTRPFACRFCERIFCSVKGKGQHESNAHPEMLDASEPGPTKARWQESEKIMLAIAEAEIRLQEGVGVGSTTLAMNELSLERAKQNPHFIRTFDAVKSRRRLEDHTRRVATEYVRLSIGIEPHANEGVEDQQIHQLGDVSQVDLERELIRDDSVPNEIHDNNGDVSVLSTDHSHDPVANQSLDGSISDGDIVAVSRRTSVEDPAMGVCDRFYHFSECVDCDCKRKLIDSIEATLSTSMGGNEIEILSKLYTDGIESFDPKRFANCAGNSGHPGGNRAVPESAEGEKRSTGDSVAKRQREIFEKRGPRALIEHLRNPSVDTMQCGEETALNFQRMFETEDSLDNEPIAYTKDTRKSSHVLHSPVTANEVNGQLRAIPKGKAPGLDNLKVADLLQQDSAHIACLFNIFLLYGNVPHCLKINRTTLIPKKPEPGPNDWRPITISSIYDRLLGKILDRRVNEIVVLNSLQRAFRRGTDGCGENIAAFTGLRRIAKQHSRALLMLSLDLAKAFDSVQHSTIRRAMIRMGLDGTSVDLIHSLSLGNSTVIRYNSGELTAKMNRGIRQGWPLSPVLFLFVIDELLDLFEPELGFVGHTGTTPEEKVMITSVAFADDLVLFAGSEHAMQELVYVTSAFFDHRDMRINATKSFLLHLRSVPKKKKLVLCERTEIRVGTDIVPTQGTSAFRFLGVHFRQSGKVSFRGEEFISDLNLLAKCALRLRQKLAVVSTCLIPMLKYRLVYGFANKGVCMTLDKKIRRSVRQLMHFPRDLSVYHLHLPNRMGGQGLPCLVDQVIGAQCRLYHRMLTSSDRITRALVSSKVGARLGRRLSYHQPSPLPVSPQGVDEADRANFAKRRSAYLQTVQGAGSSLWENSPCRFLDTLSKSLSEKDYVYLILLRTKGLITRERVARTTHREVALRLTCRGCNYSIEDISHILTKCPATQGDVIIRHNRVRDYCVVIGRRLKARYPDLVEQVLPEYTYAVGNRGATKRPDITIVCKDKVILLEISVVYERIDEHGESSLAIIKQAKQAKYAAIRLDAARHFEKRTAIIRTMIVGARGGWIPSNYHCFSDVRGEKLSKADASIILERAMMGSLNIWKNFVARNYGGLIAPVNSRQTAGERSNRGARLDEPSFRVNND